MHRPWILPSMREGANFEIGFVVKGELVDDVGAGAIVADHLDRATLSPQARDNLVQGAHG